MIPLEEINNFLKEYGWIFAVVITVILLATILVIVLLNKRPKTDKNIAIYDYLGGKDNIIEENVKGSRLTLKLENKTLIDKEGLRKLGVMNIVEMNEKITLVLGPKLKKNFSDKK